MEVFEFYFGEKMDVFFVMFVKIYCFVVWIVFVSNDILGDFVWYVVCVVGQYVVDVGVFIVFILVVFNLVCSNCVVL